MAISRTALIAGASGLVGRHCLTLLLQDGRYDRVVSVGRRLLPQEHPKLQQHVVDFDHLSQAGDLLRADDVYCCLGTTIKKAGSQNDFFKVDFTYVVELARNTSQQGASQFLVVSALGANAFSRVFYNRVKGRMEETLKEIPFRAIHIFQPSVLLGKRDETRPLEKVSGAIMTLLGFLMLGQLRKFRPIHATKVAAAMVATAAREDPGIHAYSSDRF